MKRLIITILGVILAISFAYSDNDPSFGQNTVSLKIINKSGGDWRALFNLYDEVYIEKDAGEGPYGGAILYKDCWGGGWNPCRFRKTADELGPPPADITPAQWESVNEAGKNLNLLSEREAADGNYIGSASEVLQMEDTYGNTIYFVVTANWEYEEVDQPVTGEVKIKVTWYENYPPQ